MEFHAEPPFLALFRDEGSNPVLNIDRKILKTGSLMRNFICALKRSSGFMCGAVPPSSAAMASLPLILPGTHSRTLRKRTKTRGKQPGIKSEG